MKIHLNIPKHDEIDLITNRILTFIGQIQSTTAEYQFHSFSSFFHETSDYKEITSILMYGSSNVIFNENDYSGLYSKVMGSLESNIENGMERLFAQFVLSLPSVTYDFSKFLREQRMAHASRSSFMEELTIQVDSSCITKIRVDDVRNWLGQMFKSCDLYPLALSSIFRISAKPTNRKEADVSLRCMMILDPIITFLGLAYTIQLILWAKNSPLVPKGYKENDNVRPDVAILHRVEDRIRILPIEGRPEQSKTNPTSSANSSSNHESLNDNERIVALVDFKALPLFYGPATNIKISDLINDHSEIIRQVEASMIAARVRYGIIWDSQYLILLLFDDKQIKNWNFQPVFNDRHQRSTSGPLKIPLQVMILDKSSKCPTMLEALSGFLHSAKIDTSAEEYFRRIPVSLVEKTRGSYESENWKDNDENRDDSSKGKDDNSKKSTGEGKQSTAPYYSMDSYVIDDKPTLMFPGISSNSGSRRHWSSGSILSFSSGSTRPVSDGSEFSIDTTASSIELSDRKIPLIKLDYTMDTDVLQRSRSCFSQVYRIRASYLKKFILEPIEDDEFIVMKIYDTTYPIKLLEQFGNNSSCISSRYHMEKKCIEILQGVPNFNSVHLHHNEVIVDYYFGHSKPIIGKVILSKYIHKIEIPRNDLSLYRKAQEQLSLIHKSGIIYKDIKRDNLFIERGTNKVYFFDFNSVKFVSHIVSDPTLYALKIGYDIFVKSEEADEEFKEDENKLGSLFE